MIDEYGFDEFGRPCKDLYAMHISFTVCERSLDQSTKCGCTITDREGALLCTGYNGPVMGSIDSNVPREREDKDRYIVMEHSERNAIYLAAKNGISLRDSIFFITGIPCLDCLRGIIQVGAEKIVYGPNTARMINDEYISKYHLILSGSKISIERFKYDKGLYKLMPSIEEEMSKKAQIETSRLYKKQEKKE